MHDTIITPANRVQEIKEYYFSRKLREVAQLNAEGKDIISLGIGGPDRPPHKSVTDTLIAESLKSDTHSYQPYTGIPELRESMANWYQRTYGVSINPKSEVLPLIGSKEGVLHISLTFLNPGDGVLVPDPGYPTYTSVSKLVGAEIFNYDLTENNGWFPDFKQLEKLPLERIKLMWVNYPHMPTGTRANLDVFTKLLEFGRRHNIVIVNDNPYSLILNDTPTSIMQINGANEIAIELNSMSKSHNMAGWRVGMAVSNAKFIEWILKVKSNIDSGQFKPLMSAAAVGLTLDHEWFEELNSEYQDRRAIAEQILTELDCYFDPNQTGLFLWGRIPDNMKSGEELADDLLYNARVFVTPGSVFGKNGYRYIRLSLCATTSRLSEALNRIKQYKNIKNNNE
ncbi:MAG: aminotransferase class I/II-fold pyridoxal phosphate-dependent enzyme [Muribaculum sp.]|nr:aminotransferase class I/II-fold pyridoxal phosphate-dependent enzyme [Muribaculum sp.]